MSPIMPDKPGRRLEISDIGTEDIPIDLASEKDKGADKPVQMHSWPVPLIW